MRLWTIQGIAIYEQMVNENTSSTDPYRIELELLSNLVADYSEAHFSIDKSMLDR